MSRYARETTVPVEQSRAEIESMLIRYGADGFQSGWTGEKAMVMFRMHDLVVRFILPIPKRDETRFTHRKNKRTGRVEKMAESTAERAYQQEIRSRWRALCLVVKAKLEAVECGISTLENEFLAFIVLPDSTTFGEWATIKALPQIRGGDMPSLMLGQAKESGDEQ